MTDSRLTPDQAELVKVARATFVEELLPLLPADKRLTGLMVANALAIALRMIEHPQGDEGGVPELCAEIRAGGHDEDDAGRLRAHLIKRTLARLALSNPKQLAQAELALTGDGRS
ncbi:DUF6285 domain-containing protein [Geminicoccus roseus]|uniref:DUF6285 domain-containing protein n=1 Tax=Geminicoccus roseus TaxID=404900 RepID=UPI0003F7E05A|nr:DUF6285 domain-containing protein [Geminicoccus roseus]